jgi:hypothetical protein
MNRSRDPPAARFSFAAVNRLRTLGAGRIVPADLRSAIGWAGAPQPISSVADSAAQNYSPALGRPHYSSKRTSWPVASTAGLCHNRTSTADEVRGSRHFHHDCAEPSLSQLPPGDPVGNHHRQSRTRGTLKLNAPTPQSQVRIIGRFGPGIGHMGGFGRR